MHRQTSKFKQYVIIEPFLVPKKLDSMTLFFGKHDLMLYDQTKMTKLKHTTAAQRSITSENRQKIW